VLEEGFIRELKKALNQLRHRRLDVSRTGSKNWN
jgi:hypothetical protein